MKKVYSAIGKEIEALVKRVDNLMENEQGVIDENYEFLCIATDYDQLVKMSALCKDHKIHNAMIGLIERFSELKGSFLIQETNDSFMTIKEARKKYLGIKGEK